jgi:hypothetical protein
MKNFQRTSNGGLASHTFPGCYPLYYVTDGNEVLCPDCANAVTNQETLIADANYEDESLYCDVCSNHIDSAYGSDNEEDTI